MASPGHNELIPTRPQADFTFNSFIYCIFSEKHEYVFFFILWIIFMSIITYILTSCDIMIPYFLLALFSHLNSAFRRVPSAVTPFPIDSPNSFYWPYIISPQWNDTSHDDIMKWKYFLHYRPFVRAIHQSLVDSLYKGPAMWNFRFFMSAQTSCSTNIHLTSDLRWWRSCDISVMNSWNNTLQRKKRWSAMF